MKKGELAWEVIVKLVFVVAVLLFLLLVVYLLREKLFALFERMTGFLRFGA